MLSSNPNELRYYESDTLTVKPKGLISLDTSTSVRRAPSMAGKYSEYNYELHTPKRIWYISCESEEELVSWTNKLALLIEDSKSEHEVSNKRMSGKVICYSQGQRKREDRSTNNLDLVIERNDNMHLRDASTTVDMDGVGQSREIHNNNNNNVVSFGQATSAPTIVSNGGNERNDHSSEKRSGPEEMKRLISVKKVINDAIFACVRQLEIERHSLHAVASVADSSSSKIESFEQTLQQMIAVLDVNTDQQLKP